MTSPQVSVVVPVYDVAETIERCLRSICAQSLEQIEVIVVDDGSPGGEWPVIAAMAREDSRIHAYRKGNGGLADARNYGVARAAGRWVTFVDSDDTLPPNALEVLLEIAMRRDATVAMGRYRYHRLDGRIDVQGGLPIASGSVLEGYRFLLQHASMVSVAKLYGRSLLERFPQPTGFWFEDVAWTPTVMTHVDRVAYIDDVVYDYRPRVTSITKRVEDIRTLDGIRAVQIGLRDANPEHRDAVAVMALRRLLFEVRQRPAYADRYLAEIATLRPDLENNPYLSRDRRLRRQGEPYMHERVWIPKRLGWVSQVGSTADTAVRSWMANLAYADGEFVEIAIPPDVSHIAGPTHAADLAGLQWLYREGGVLLRPTLRAHGPIAPLLGDGAFVVRDMSGKITGEIIGGTARNQFVARVLEKYRRFLSHRCPPPTHDLLGYASEQALSETTAGVVVYGPARPLCTPDGASLMERIEPASSGSGPTMSESSDPVACGTDRSSPRLRWTLFARRARRIVRNSDLMVFRWLRTLRRRSRAIHRRLDFYRRTRPSRRRLGFRR